MTPMTRDDRVVWPDDVPVGTFSIEDITLAGYPGATACILFVCPNRVLFSVLLGPANVPKPAPDGLAVWAWDGNRDQPTLSPSIDCKRTTDAQGRAAGGCGWHGFIAQGRIG